MAECDCAICFRPLHVSSRRNGALPCGHAFHTHCISRWEETDHMTCPICRAQLPQRPNRSPARRRRSLSSEGCFYILLPDDWHNRAGRGRLGRLAVFRCAGDVRPQLRELQRSTARQDDGAAALKRHSKAVLRLFFDHALGPGPMVLDDRLVQPVLGGNHMAVMHATMCAAACAALREPGFRVLDREPGVLPGVSYSNSAAAEQELSALEDAWFSQLFGGLIMPSFTAAQMLEGIPQLGTEAAQLSTSLENRGAGAQHPTSAEDFAAALMHNSAGLGEPVWQPRLDELHDEDDEVITMRGHHEVIMRDGEIVVVRDVGDGGDGGLAAQLAAQPPWRRLLRTMCSAERAYQLLALAFALGALSSTLSLGRVLFGNVLVPLGSLGAASVAFLSLLFARCLEAGAAGHDMPANPAVDPFWPERRWARVAALALVAALAALLGTGVSLIFAACVGAVPVGGIVFIFAHELILYLVRNALSLRQLVLSGLKQTFLGVRPGRASWTLIGVALGMAIGALAPAGMHDARVLIFGSAGQAAPVA